MTAYYKTHYNYEQRGGSHLGMRQQVEYKNNQKVINQLKLFVSFIKRWCTLNITKLNKSSPFNRSNSQPISLLNIIMSDMEDHISELDSKANKITTRK